MKKLILTSMLAAAAFAAGTGRADESRLNLWPLVGYEDGALDVIWPLGHFKDSGEWRFFPVIKDHDLFCVFPEFWFTDDGFAVLPFYAKYDFREGTLFPVLWWDLAGSDKMHSVFQLYYYHGCANATTFWAGCGLAGYKRYNDETSHWLLPLYMRTGSGFYSIPYSRTSHSTSRDEAYLCGFAGRKTALDGTTYAHWCFPLWHKDRNSFTSLPYHREWDDKGETTSWLSVLALSGGWRDRPYWKERYLLGLAGRNRNDKNGYSDSWLAPFYYADNQGTLVTPVYGQAKTAKWGLPGWYTDDHTFASPLWYSHTDDQNRLDQWMVPLLLSGGVYRDGVRRNGFLLNAAGWKSGDDGYFASWCMPLYFKDSEGTFITPLYGRNKSSQWCFPLWYNDERSLYSLLWCQRKDEAGELESWVAPLLLSGGRTKSDGTRESDILLGLGGATWGGKDGLRSSWAFPLYYENSAGAFVTPLGGWNRDSSWILPLFYTDKEAFVSLPYMHGRSESKKSDTYVVPPLLSGYTKHDDGRTDLCALVLYGHSRGAQGETRYDYLLPLYHYNGETGDFISLPYGRDVRGSYTNTWWATPLVGTRSGSKTGGWLFPLFNRRKDASFDKDLARMDSPTIPDDIAFSDQVKCWTNGEGRVCFRTNCIASARIDSETRGSVLLASDHDHWVYSGVSCGEKEYTLHEGSKQGNRIFFNSEFSRTVTYDIPSRRKKGERSDSETMALCGLFYSEHREDSMKGTSHTHTRVLWKLWDWEEENGDVALDVFPGFTYDSKTNGYSKTSFLWRFFRYENDPENGKKVDLFFLPVWR